MNSEKLLAEWANICDVIRSYDSINASQMNAFFSRLQPQAMSEDFLMLTADNDFIKTWIELHYSRYIQKALREIHGVDFTVAIEVDINQAPPSEQAAGEPSPFPVKPLEENPFSDEEEALQAGAVLEDSKEQATTSEAPNQSVSKDATDTTGSLLSSTSTLTFENFVIGESNRMAYSMAVAVAEEPGRPLLNPLFIYGRSGLGKTHLMRAIQNYVNEAYPHLVTVYEDSADFLAGYVEATLAHDTQKTSFKNFKNKYLAADILMIDDIQYLQGKDQTLDIVFQIFNKLVDEGKQVVLSADRAPKNITMDERYQSRFNSGGTFDIQPPEVETKLGIIKSFIEEYRRVSNLTGFELPEDIERYIAENSSSNIRELKSAVTKVIFKINSSPDGKVNVDEVAELLEDHFSGGAMRKLTIADIQKQVEQYYDVSHADLIGQKRSRKIVYARQIAIYLSRQMLNQPYNYIAKSFGGRDHTTIMYSVTNVEEKLKENRELREELENIKRRIRDM
ncbi:MAG: chromosomal replication initiator protein DnaA [Eggerthellaceae bacterium]|nr:chromosomal replication initiator protein DnaA [Eggerthellaceae bacterium]